MRRIAAGASLSTAAALAALVLVGCSKPAASADSAAGVNAAATAAPATDPAAVRHAIDSANARFLDAFKRGDTAVMVGNYADDAVVMMPNEEAWHGRDAMVKGLAGFLSQMTLKEGKNETKDVMVSGDLAVETGTYEWTLQPKGGGKEMKDRGKYITVWKRQGDGSWKIVRDINNSDLKPSA